MAKSCWRPGSQSSIDAIAVMMTTPIRAAIRPYSIAVGPPELLVIVTSRKHLRERVQAVYILTQDIHTVNTKRPPKTQVEGGQYLR